MKKHFFVLIFCSCLQVLLTLHAQEVYRGLKQTIDFTIDKIGNADIEVSMQLTAEQWDNFKKTIGSNISLIKRQMERSLPKYYLADFNYTEEGMDRSYKVKFKALGISTIKKNGLWETDLDVEKPDITKVSDRDFVINEDVLVNGTLVQQTLKLHLPSVATNAKVEKDSLGKAVFTYETRQDLLSLGLTVLGGLLVLLGIWWFYRNSKSTKSKSLATPGLKTEIQADKKLAGEAMKNAEIEARESEEKKAIELKPGDII